jgi:RNA polymerase sigma-70 factor (ECF subfamily)
VDDISRLAFAAAGGDRDAFALFVRRTQADVWRLCARLVDPDAVDDVTQETYLRAAKALPSFRGDGTARAWLLAIARRTAADEVRRRRRRRALQARLSAHATHPGTASESGQVDLDALIGQLTENRRTAFVLTQTLGLSYQEAAEVCGCPVGTIRSRVARARLDLLDAFTAAGNQAAGADDH